MSIVAGNHKLHIEYGKKNVSFHCKGNECEEEKTSIKCVIKNLETDEDVAVSEVTKHHKDIPNRISGRTYAIKKAIDQIPTREDKKALWKAVNEKFKLKFS